MRGLADNMGVSFRLTVGRLRFGATLVFVGLELGRSWGMSAVVGAVSEDLGSAMLVVSLMIVEHEWLAGVNSALAPAVGMHIEAVVGSHLQEDQVDSMHQYVDSIVLFAVSLPLFRYRILLFSFCLLG